jgi:3-oxo-5alpha-steroid 4-dehydrogenase
MSSEPRVTRRDLIKGAAAGAVALSGAGALSGCGPTIPSKLPAKWDREADVVVVGFGAAGAATAIEAARAGAEVIVLERMPVNGGSSVLCGGIVYMGGGTPLQKATGFEDSVDNMYQYMFAAAGNGADPEMVRIYCESSLDLYNWLDGLGVEFKQSFIPGKYAAVPTDDGLAFSGNELQANYKNVAKPVPRGHHVKGMGETGKVLFPILQKAAEAAGAKVFTETPARRLVVNNDGRVVGVVVDVDGTEEYIKARKGVVLSAGGYAANKAMMAQHCPIFLRCGIQTGTPADDGAGIRMGQGAGGDLRMMGDAFAYAAIYEFGEGLVKGILVDDKGTRFVGEDNYGIWIGKEIVRRHPVAFLVIDQPIWDSLHEKSKGFLVVKGKADTIADLAKALNINLDALQNTVDFYNEQAAKGQDPAFSKDEHYLTPLKQGPFRALDFSSAQVHCFTTGGLRINSKANVLDAQGNPVPGLYAVGRNAFAVSAENYPASGSSLGEGMIFGRIAGRTAAADKAWDKA